MIPRRSFITIFVAVAAWPIAAHAQQAMPVIGFLNTVSSNTFSRSYLNAFQLGLREIGFSLDKNMTIEYRWADDNYDRLPTLATELVRRQVSIIAAFGSANSPQAARAATADIPIVFATGSDPVRIGLVANLSRPGGNLTGVTFFTSMLDAKRLEL